MVNVTFDVSELFRWIRRVTLVYDLIVVAIFDEFSEVVFFIDVEGLGYCKLRQPLLEMWVERPWVNEKTRFDNVFAKFVLWDHTSDSCV